MKPVLALRHVPHETLGNLEVELNAVGLRCEYVDLFQANAAQAFEPGGWSALVVLGGPMNVDQTDRYPFLAREVEWIRQAIAAELPVLGICLGSQLLAKALGASVRANGIKEIGWYDVALTADAKQDRLFGDCQPVLPVFQWHGDTWDLPEGATLLATGAACRHQAFRFGELAWGLQFHWEVTPAMVCEWLCESGGCAEIAALDYIDGQQIHAAIDEKWPAMHAAASPVFARFAKLCVDRAAS